MQPRRLLLVRHAKAADGPVDADRPLTDRDERHAAAIVVLRRYASEASGSPSLPLAAAARI